MNAAFGFHHSINSKGELNMKEEYTKEEGLKEIDEQQKIIDKNGIYCDEINEEQMNKLKKSVSLGLANFLRIKYLEYEDDTVINQRPHGYFTSDDVKSIFIHSKNKK